MIDPKKFRVLPAIIKKGKIRKKLSSTLLQLGFPKEMLVFTDQLEDALELLRTEFPPLYFLDFSNPELCPFEILSAVEKDSWLVSGGIIAICDSFETEKQIDEQINAHIIVTIYHNDILNDLPTILSVVSDNIRLLYQHRLHMEMIKHISGSFRLHNDVLEAHCYSRLISNFLYTTRKVDQRGKQTIMLALQELLLNAVEHGNCEIGYDEKSQWLDDGRDIRELISLKKEQNPELVNRRVLFEYDIRDRDSRFLIADQGGGFDWRKRLNNKNDQPSTELHGRGLLLASHMTKNLQYNEKGNEVQFEITHQKETENLLPESLEKMETTTVEPAETVFMQGEAGDFMYYIVKGTYSVEVDDSTVSTLGPNDVFMGEMSFLLNQRRNATVVAITRGKLIKISKRDFVTAIRNNPHYGLFLARLLAQRIQRMNASNARMEDNFSR